MLQDKRAEEEEGKGGQQAELDRPEKGAVSGCAEDGCSAGGLGSCGVASGVA
jgi:hypothetical protein